MIIVAVNSSMVTVTHFLCILPTFNAMHNVSITVTVIIMIMMIIFAVNSAIVTVTRILFLLSAFPAMHDVSMAVTVIFIMMMIIVAVNSSMVTVTHFLFILPTFKAMNNVSITVAVIIMIMRMSVIMWSILTLFMTVLLNTSAHTWLRVSIIFRGFDVMGNNFPRDHFTISYHAETNAWGIYASLCEYILSFSS